MARGLKHEIGQGPITTILQKILKELDLLKKRIASGGNSNDKADITYVDSQDVIVLNTANYYADSKINGIYQPNVLISAVPPTRVTNTFTFPALGYDALINKVRYKNSIDFVTTIDVATTNYKRTDLIYITTGGIIGKKVGNESTTVSIRPDLNIDEVAISFINVFGSIIETPTLIDNNISIQNSVGSQQFTIKDFVRFRGTSFNSNTKEIIIDPLVPFTAFVDNTNGNDNTGEFGNSNKPFKTIDKVFSLFEDNGRKQLTISIINQGSYAINQPMPLNYVEIKSLLPVTLDFSNNVTNLSNNKSFFISEQGGTYDGSLYFNIPNGSLVNNRLGGNIGIFLMAQCDMKINIKYIYWNSKSSMFYSTKGCNIEYIGHLETLGRFSIGAPVTTNFKANKVTVMATGSDSTLMGIAGDITIGELVLNNNQNIFWGTQVLRLGSNVTGTGKLSMNYQVGNITIVFNNTSLLVPFSLSQGFENITLTGSLKVFTVDTSTQASSGNLNLLNLNVSSMIGFLQAYSAFTVNIINSTIKVNSILVKTLGVTTKVNITNSVIEQVTPTHLVETTGIINLKLAGLETNATSLGNNSNVIVDYALQSFKDKSKEVVIRSKVDLVNKVLSAEVSYIIDGIINILPTDSVIVPIGGLSLSGYGFDVSAIKAIGNNSTIFTNPAEGCGNLFIQNLSIEASGTGSKVFNLTNSGAVTGGADAIELGVVNFNNCTSLGTVKNFRQGLWNNVGIFGCKEGITFEGVWSGGFRADLVIVRNFGVAGVGGTLFKAGADLLFKSRFLTDINADFKASGNLSDFIAANFNTTKLYQIKAAQVTRGGVLDDTQNYTGALSAFSPQCDWSGNNGMKNSNLHPYGITTDKMTTYANDVDAATGGVVIGEVYIEATTGYFKTRIL